MELTKIDESVWIGISTDEKFMNDARKFYNETLLHHKNPESRISDPVIQETRPDQFNCCFTIQNSSNIINANYSSTGLMHFVITGIS